VFKCHRFGGGCCLYVEDGAVRSVLSAIVSEYRAVSIIIVTQACFAILRVEAETPPLHWHVWRSLQGWNLMYKN